MCMSLASSNWQKVVLKQTLIIDQLLHILSLETIRRFYYELNIYVKMAKAPLSLCRT